MITNETKSARSLFLHFIVHFPFDEVILTVVVVSMFENPFEKYKKGGVYELKLRGQG